MGQREGTIFPFCREIYSYDDPPSGLSNKICLTFWHLSKEVRSVLTSPAWKDRIKKSEFPFFCMNNGLCKYFDNKNSLDQHYIKNPSHRNVNFSKCKEEAARRVQLRSGSYSNYLDHGSKQTNYSDHDTGSKQTNYSDRDPGLKQTNYSDRDRADPGVKKLSRKKGSTSTPAPSSSPPRKSPTPTFRKSPTPTFRKSPTPTFRKSPTPTFRKSPTPTFRKSPTPTFSIQGNCCPQDPCGNCDLCRPALQKQQQQQNRPRPPSPTEPHPDEVKALNFSRTPEQTNNFQPSPSPSPSPPPSAKNREATPLRQTSKNVGISLIPPLPVFSSIPEISTVPGLASMVAIPAVSTLPGIPTLPALPTALSREAAPMHLVQTQTAKKPKLDTGKSNNQVQKDVQFNENVVKPQPVIKPRQDPEKAVPSHPTNKDTTMRPPTTESSNILSRLNFSMPKPEFLRSNSVHDSHDSISTSTSVPLSNSSSISTNSRDPRKRRLSQGQALSRTTSMISSSAAINSSPDFTQSPDSTMLSQPTPPKNQRLVPNSANNNAGSKISLNHYLKRLHSKNTDEYDEVFERNKVDIPLPLPAPDELFQGVDEKYFADDKPDLQTAMETEKDSVKVEEGDVLEQYLSKKSTRVSSWTRSSSQVAKEKGEENGNQSKQKKKKVIKTGDTIHKNVKNDSKPKKCNVASELESKSKKENQEPELKTELKNENCEVIDDLFEADNNSELEENGKNQEPVKIVSCKMITRPISVQLKESSSKLDTIKVIDAPRVQPFTKKYVKEAWVQPNVSEVIDDATEHSVNNKSSHESNSQAVDSEFIEKPTVKIVNKEEINESVSQLEMKEVIDEPIVKTVDSEDAKTVDSEEILESSSQIENNEVIDVPKFQPVDNTEIMQSSLQSDISEVMPLAPPVNDKVDTDSSSQPNNSEVIDDEPVVPPVNNKDLEESPLKPEVSGFIDQPSVQHGNPTAIEMTCVNKELELTDIEENKQIEEHELTYVEENKQSKKTELELEDNNRVINACDTGHVTIVFDESDSSDHDIIREHLGQIIATIATSDEVPEQLVFINDNNEDTENADDDTNSPYEDSNNPEMNDENVISDPDLDDENMLYDPDLDDSDSAAAILRLSSVSSSDENPKEKVINETAKIITDSNVFIDTNPDIATSVGHVEVKSISPINENTVVLIYGVDKSVDFCPNCEKRLCPFKGAYTLNVVTYDVSVVCNGCSKTVVIKDLFSERQKALVWNDTKV